MKLSLNWVKEFTEINLEKDELLERIGTQIGGIEEVIDLGEQYKGIVVAKVIACEKHPDADRLSVCRIDDGRSVDNMPRDGEGYTQVVCGAPNVKAGQTVAWLPPGVTVPSTYGKQPMVLDSRDIRGQQSNGMIASASELGFSDDHDGILVIDVEASPGEDFAKLYKLNDTVIDIENKMFTHRPDLFGILGIARELAGIQKIKFHSPDWYRQALRTAVDQSSFEELELHVENNAPDFSPRFCALAMSGVSVAPSPILMQTYLSRVGLRPINNIVDITNFIMHLTAQPLHAFDYDKVKALDGSNSATIQVKAAKPGDKLELLNGKTITLRDDDFVIASAGHALGLAGVMGGGQTEVTAATKNIILECANFNMYEVRRMGMGHGIFSDAWTRFTKNQSPLQNDKVLAYAAHKVGEISGGLAASKMFDEFRDLPEPATVEVSTDFINTRLGTKLSAEDIAELLQNVEFEVEAVDNIKIKAPFWRRDISQPEDIVEETGRLFGYDKLPMKLPLRDLSAARRNELLLFNSRLRHFLAGAGLNEVLNYSFVNSKLLENANQDKNLAFHVKNALSPNLNYYRLSLTPSLLEKIHPNIKAGYEHFGLFELNKVHQKNILDGEQLPQEQARLAVVLTATKKAETVNYAGSAFYLARYYLDNLLDQLRVKAEVRPLAQADNVITDNWRQAAKPYDASRAVAVIIDGIMAGVAGEFAPNTRAGFKLPNFNSGLELDVAKLMQASSHKASYQPINKYPPVQQDICLKVSSATDFAAVSNFLSGEINSVQNDSGYQVQLVPADIYQNPQDQAHKQLTFSLSFQHPDKTLTDQEVNSVMDKIAEKAKSVLQAERV